jgi:uncharacterized protein YjbI with pentapeptide repeats
MVDRQGKITSLAPELCPGIYVMKPTPKTAIRGILVVALLSYALVALAYGIWQGYLVDWTGFKDFIPPTPNPTYVRAKTLWDWMDLLFVPLMLAVAAYALDRSGRNAERERAKETEELERKIATDRQQELALQTYLDKMTDLLLKENLRTSENKEAQNMAKIRTVTLLSGLDANRKKLVVLFLKESGLINLSPIIDLDGANLSEIHAVSVDLSASKLSAVTLDRCNLSGANLDGADLRKSQLVDAQLIGTHLNGANLFGANLHGAHLAEAELREANLNSVNLTAANLAGADLTGASLRLADLTGANLTGAILYGVSLNGAHLRGANLMFAEVTADQLATASWDI